VLAEARTGRKEMSEVIKARRVLAATAVGLLALSGCVHDSGVAARVGGATLTEAQVRQAADAVAAADQTNDAGLYLAPVASAVVQGLVAGQVAAANGVALTDATRAETIGAYPSLAQLQQLGAGALADRMADYVYTRTKLGEDAFLAGCAAVPVSVNPHYGNWSKELCSLDGQSGSLSRAAKAAS